MKTYEIDQEELCHSCKENSSRCEGTSCDFAREDYANDHGLIEKKSLSFIDLKPGDNIYVVSEYKILNIDIDEVCIDKNRMSITIHPYMFTIEKSEYGENSQNKSKAKTEVAFFIKKEDAIKKYKEIITEKMFQMHDMMNNIDKQK